MIHVDHVSVSRFKSSGDWLVDLCYAEIYSKNLSYINYCFYYVAIILYYTEVLSKKLSASDIDSIQNISI
jgi:hypothetical protein